MRKTILAVAVLALLAAGCRIETNIGFNLAADGSGTASLDVGMDDEALAFVETTGQSFRDACSTDAIGDLVGENPLDGVIGEGAAEPTSVEVVEEDGLTVCRTAFAFDDIQALASSADADGLDLDVQISDEEVRVTGTLAGDAAAAGDEDLGDLGFDLGALEDVFAVNLRITMPGEVIESNADRTLGDGTLEWNVDLFGGGDLEIEAASDPSGGGGGGGLTTVLIVVVVLALAAVALFFFLRNRQQPAAAGAPAEVQRAPESPEVPSPETQAEPEAFGPEGTEEV